MSRLGGSGGGLSRRGGSGGRWSRNCRRGGTWCCGGSRQQGHVHDAVPVAIGYVPHVARVGARGRPRGGSHGRKRLHVAHGWIEPVGAVRASFAAHAILRLRVDVLAQGAVAHGRSGRRVLASGAPGAHRGGSERVRVDAADAADGRGHHPGERAPGAGVTPGLARSGLVQPRSAVGTRRDRGRERELPGGTQRADRRRSRVRVRSSATGVARGLARARLVVTGDTVPAGGPRRRADGPRHAVRAHRPRGGAGRADGAVGARATGRADCAGGAVRAGGASRRAGLTRVAVGAEPSRRADFPRGTVGAGGAARRAGLTRVTVGAEPSRSTDGAGGAVGAGGAARRAGLTSVAVGARAPGRTDGACGAVGARGAACRAGLTCRTVSACAAR